MALAIAVLAGLILAGFAWLAVSHFARRARIAAAERQAEDAEDKREAPIL